jgi:hypothetical protein
MTGKALTLLGVPIFVVAAACSHGGSRIPVTAKRDIARDDSAKVDTVIVTTVKVENRAYLDVDVFVVRSGQRQRLGTVTGNSTQRLVIPANFLFGVTPLQFSLHQIGGSRRDILTDQISVTAGDEVSLIVPPTLRGGAVQLSNRTPF